MLATAVWNRWETDWTQRWFYHTSPPGGSLRSTEGPIDHTTSPEVVLIGRKESLLRLLLGVTRRISTRDLVEEFCTFRVWPLV